MRGMSRKSTVAVRLAGSWTGLLQLHGVISVFRAGPRGGSGWGGGGAGPHHFLKKKKLRNTHFLIKGISDGIRILD